MVHLPLLALQEHVEQVMGENKGHLTKDNAYYQAGHWGFQYYRPHPHKTANYRPIFIFSTVPVSPVKIFANTIETGNLEKFL